MKWYPKIDLVYTWVDNCQSDFAEVKDKHIKAYMSKQNPFYYDEITHEVAGSKRFTNNDELKFSLRSVEKYAGWVNKIHIVTYNQIPEWLNINHPKINMVFHKDIMPQDAIPCFNSNSIELCLHNIPNLSEYYIYGNDDMFFQSPIKPSFFFNKNDQSFYRTYDNIISKKKNKLGDYLSIYDQRHYNSINLIKKIFGKTIENFPCHCFVAYNKSIVTDCYNKFSNEINESIHHKFRCRQDYNRIIFELYSWCINKTIHINISKQNVLSYKISSHLKKFNNCFIKNLIENVVMFFSRPECYYAEYINKDVYKFLRKKKPHVFCINDSKGNDEYKNDLNFYLNKIFPEKSQFEL